MKEEAMNLKEREEYMRSCEGWKGKGEINTMNLKIK